MSNNKSYLGDGVYADHDGYSIVLTAENGYSIQNTIYLEPDLITALLTYIERTCKVHIKVTNVQSESTNEST